MAYSLPFIPLSRSEGQWLHQAFIVDYSHLTLHLRPARMVLSNVFQVAKSKPIWKPDIFAMKLDLTNAFFNILVAPSSRFIPAF